ncbi:MAG: monovalent cation/H(+) antiporter subunit G [Gammaproteobacteria bacterium]
MSETLGLTLIGVGVLFDLFGCIGLVRLPDVYNRLQAATKCVTAGTCLIVIGSVVWLASPAAAVKGLLCIGFILVTSPTGAHALARAAHRSGVALWRGSIVDRYAERSGEAPP